MHHLQKDQALFYYRSVGTRVLLFKVELVYKRNESCLGKHVEKSCNHFPIHHRKWPSIYSPLFFIWDGMDGTKDTFVSKRSLDI